MTKIKKDLADDYHKCITMQEEAKQSNKAAAEATKATKAAESRLSSATSALEKATTATTASIQDKIKAVESALTRVNEQESKSKQMTEQIGTLHQLLTSIASRQT